jgi:hypothetical protein
MLLAGNGVTVDNFSDYLQAMNSLHGDLELYLVVSHNDYNGTPPPLADNHSYTSESANNDDNGGEGETDLDDAP